MVKCEIFDVHIVYPVLVFIRSLVLRREIKNFQVFTIHHSLFTFPDCPLPPAEKIVKNDKTSLPKTKHDYICPLITTNIDI